VRSLDPYQIRIGINPERESHTTNRSWGIAAGTVLRPY
jgi:hypothetical protein